MATLSHFESQARDLLDKARVNSEWSQSRIATLNALRVLWAESFDVRRVREVANVLGRTNFDDDTVEAVLVDLCKWRVLRRDRRTGYFEFKFD